MQNLKVIPTILFALISSFTSSAQIKKDSIFLWETSYEVVYYSFDTLNGNVRAYFTQDTSIMSFKANYKKGKLNGKKAIYYPTGQIYSLAHYKNGKCNGKRIKFFEDGKRESVINYRNGVKQGWTYFYMSSGAWFFKGYYRNDELKKSIWHDPVF